MHDDTYNMAEFMQVSNTQVALGRVGAVKGHDAQQHMLCFNKNASPHTIFMDATLPTSGSTQSQREWVHSLVGNKDFHSFDAAQEMLVKSRLYVFSL